MEADGELRTHCPNGHWVQVGAKFCSECGSQVNDVEQERTCSQGHRISSDDLFCPECGVPADTSDRNPAFGKASLSPASLNRSSPWAPHEEPTGVDVRSQPPEAKQSQRRMILAMAVALVSAGLLLAAAATNSWAIVTFINYLPTHYGAQPWGGLTIVLALAIVIAVSYASFVGLKARWRYIPTLCAALALGCVIMATVSAGSSASVDVSNGNFRSCIAPQNDCGSAGAGISVGLGLAGGIIGLIGLGAPLINDDRRRT